MDRASAFAKGYERGYDFGFNQGFTRCQQERFGQTPSQVYYDDKANAKKYLSDIHYPDLGTDESKDLNKIFYQAFEEAYRIGFGRGLERGSKP